MKRTRRVSIEIERCETWVSLTINDGRADAARPDAPERPVPGVTCTICGAPLALVVRQNSALAGPYADQILAAFLRSGPHPPLYVGGDLWVCSQSFQHLNHTLRSP